MFALPRALTILTVLALLLAAAPRQEARHLINERRVDHGCAPLASTGPHLLASARHHSREMADAGYIFHSVLRIGHWSKVGEVVGVATRWRDIITLLFQSPEHRRILLDCHYDRIALGFYFDGEAWLTGRVYAD